MVSDWDIPLSPKLICRFNTIPITISFYDKLVLKLIGLGTGPKMAKSLDKENKVRRVTLPEVKACYLDPVTNRAWKDRRKINETL